MLFLLSLSVISFVSCAFCYVWMKTNKKNLPSVQLLPQDVVKDLNFPKISLVVPAYNEEHNVKECLNSILKSTDLDFQLILVDDKSSDNTLKLAKEIKDKRLEIIEGKNRPIDKIWNGKNWACWQGAKCVKGDYIIFLDCDVHVKKQGIESLMVHFFRQDLDLLSAMPGHKFSTFLEGTPQSIVLSGLLLGKDFKKINSSECKEFLAVGQCMIFKKDSYFEIGGHFAVAGEVLEDVALAGLVKKNNMKLQLSLATDLLDICMYRNIKELWEGYSKNTFLAANSNILQVFGWCVGMVLIYILPWFSPVLWLFLFATQVLDYAIFVPTVVFTFGLILSFFTRTEVNQFYKIPLKYWFFSWLGAIIMIGVFFNSFWVITTGKNWTWKGRRVEGLGN